ARSLDRPLSMTIAGPDCSRRRSVARLSHQSGAWAPIFGEDHAPPKSHSTNCTKRARVAVNRTASGRLLAARRQQRKGARMLALRPSCECCDKDLPPQATDAMICTFECTFCRDCVETRLGGRCPNCGG